KNDERRAAPGSPPLRRSSSYLTKKEGETLLVATRSYSSLSVFSSSSSSASFLSVLIWASLAPSFCLMSSPMVPPAAASAADVFFGLFDGRVAGLTSLVEDDTVTASPLRIER